MPSDLFQAAMRRRDLMALSAGALATAALQACGAAEDEAGHSGEKDATAGGGTGAPTPDCVLTHEQEEGPFYIDLAEVRRDIVEDRPGVPLALALTVVDAETCEPIRDAAVDVWHCDALGVYSGEPTEGSEGETFLRGIQLTDTNGLAEFATIYPGQYPGRTTHIHLKVRLGGGRNGNTYAGGQVAHVGQLFTDDQRDEEVFALAPYDQSATEVLPREADGIFQTQGGSSAVLTLAPAGAELARDGLQGSVTLGVATMAQ